MSRTSESVKISLDEMRQAIERSGYLLEQRIRPIIERHGYFVETNPAYPDPETGTSREYDISAISGTLLSRGTLDFVFTVIICECENNAQPVVFFEADSPILFMHHEQVRCSGIPVKLWTGEGFERISEALRLERFHHYCQGPVAGQYCSFQRPKGDKNPWVARHDDHQHRTLTTLIDAVEAQIADHYENWRMPARNQEEPVNIQIYYPLLVLQGDLYLARPKRGGLALRKTKHVQYRREIWSSNRKGTYQVDVIHESFMRRYLKLLEKETQAIKRRLVRRRKVVRESIDRLVNEARRIKKKTKPWREILDL